ncbi:hypothetical protein LEMLEM_LOCUS6927 [Lemmus lemmus]
MAPASLPEPPCHTAVMSARSSFRKVFNLPALFQQNDSIMVNSGEFQRFYLTRLDNEMLLPK